MEQINVFTTKTEDMRDALKGFWGTEIKDKCCITYLGGLIIASGDLEDIKKKSNKDVYSWKKIGDDVYLGWIK